MLFTTLQGESIMNSATKVVQVRAIISREPSRPWIARTVEKIQLFLMSSKADSHKRFQDESYNDYLETMAKLTGF
jgi:hypothetical protein